MSEWEPIETAPKDGTRVLLWLPKSKMAVFGNWSDYYGEWDTDDSEHEAPSHWLLLSPPTERD